MPFGLSVLTSIFIVHLFYNLFQLEITNMPTIDFIMTNKKLKLK